MKINEIGGEFSLINLLSRNIPNKSDNLLKGIGDDAAVIKIDKNSTDFLIATVDTLVENEHFTYRWSEPEDVGIKAMECNVSDIASMGGIPTYAFISLVLPKETESEKVMRIYSGIDSSCKKHGVVVAGGDTTKGNLFSISITLLGIVSEKKLCLRSQAQTEDLICVTGPLGASGAALSLLKKSMPLSGYLREKHLRPNARLDISCEIAGHVNAMIDISDGLASEVGHVCHQSHKGALIYAEKIPIHPDVRAAAKSLNKSPYDFALSGGEDLELLFTIPEKKLRDLTHKGIVLHPIGKITEIDTGMILSHPSGEKIPLSGGFNHFSQEELS